VGVACALNRRQEREICPRGGGRVLRWQWALKIKGRKKDGLEKGCRCGVGAVHVDWRISKKKLRRAARPVTGGSRKEKGGHGIA